MARAFLIERFVIKEFYESGHKNYFVVINTLIDASCLVRPEADETGSPANIS